MNLMKFITYSGFPLEFFAQLRILGADTHGAGVQIAHPHHHAPQRHQRPGAEAKLLCAQHGSDGHIPAAHQLAVGLNPHPGTQAVHNQALVRLGNSQFPGQTRIMNGGIDGCRAGTAVEAGDQNHFRARLGNARGDGAYARLTDQLHVDRSLPVGAFQVVDQLSQILNEIDIMVGRRRNQTHAGGGVAALGNPWIDLAAAAGRPRRVSPLSHLNLDFLCGYRYLLVTANRAGGTCLMAEFRSVP